jgi:autotransporter-associated beta strand protein
MPPLPGYARALRTAVLTLLLSLTSVGHALAQSFTSWQATTSSTTNNWTDTANWDSGIPDLGFTIVFSSGTATRGVSNNDFIDKVISGIVVNAQAPQAFSITGNPFTIAPPPPTNPIPVGIDMSAAAQDFTINPDVALGASQQWKVGSGRTLTMNGALSGSGFSLTKSDPGTLRIISIGNSYSGSTSVTGGVLEVAPASGDITLPTSTSANSPLGTGPVSINGGELRLTPAPGNVIGSTGAPVTFRGFTFGVNGGTLNFNGNVNGGTGGPLTLTLTTNSSATAPAVIKSSSISNSANWANRGLQLNSVTGSGPVRLELTGGALATAGAIGVGGAFTLQGADNGSPAANASAVGSDGAATSVGRFAINGATANFNGGLDLRNVVQITPTGGAGALGGNVTLRGTANGTFVGFQGLGTNSAGTFGNLTIGSSSNNTLTIEGGATAVLDAQFRTDVTTIGGVVLTSRAVINPGGTLQLSQSASGADTGFHRLNGNIRGKGDGTDDSRFVVQLPNKTAAGGPTGGVNWSTSGAQFEVLGTGINGLRVEGNSANLAPVLTAGRLSTLAGAGAPAGTGGTLTFAPSDNGTTLSVAPANPSAVNLGVGSSGAGPVTVTLGAAANDLQNWGGLVVKGSSGGGSTTANLATDQTFARTTVLGGTLVVPSGVTLTSPVALNGGSLAGRGTIDGTVAVTGGRLAPGNGVGQVATGSMNWGPGGVYDFEYSSTNAPVPGADNDHINSSAGTLSLAGLSPGGFTITITYTGTRPTSGPSSPLDYTIATFGGGITGAAPGSNVTNLFSIPSGDYFSTPLVSVSGDGQRLVLSFTPVPEPAHSR